MINYPKTEPDVRIWCMEHSRNIFGRVSLRRARELYDAINAKSMPAEERKRPLGLSRLCAWLPRLFRRSES